MARTPAASQAAKVLHKDVNMADYRITHSRKDGTDADRRLDGFIIEGYGYHDIDTVIGFVKNPQNRFTVTVAGRTVRVEVQRHASSLRDYLTTEGDGFPPNNLLRLPDC
jgi:hypothetical protein